MLRAVKAAALDKFSQGDVNVYLLKEKPPIKTEEYKSNVLVIGQTGHHHQLTGKGFEIGKTQDGQFLVEVNGKGVAFAHEQHKPPIKLKPGVYLFDRAREKGMFDDMVASVAD